MTGALQMRPEHGDALRRARTLEDFDQLASEVLAPLEDHRDPDAARAELEAMRAKVARPLIMRVRFAESLEDFDALHAMLEPQDYAHGGRRVPAELVAAWRRRLASGRPMRREPRP